jgi:hypothetical protein
MTMAKMIEEKKKSDFLARTDYHERLRFEKMRQEEEERRLRSQVGCTFDWGSVIEWDG